MSGGTKFEYDTSPAARPAYGEFHAFDHVHFLVGNAKLSADWYVSRMGFKRLAYRGLETGSRVLVSHVVRQGSVTFVFTSALNPESAELLGSDVGSHLVRHGDGVKDIAFSVSDARAVFEYAVERGAKVVVPIAELSDEGGRVVMGTVQTYGDTTHTFVQRLAGYTGAFLPGFKGTTGAPDAFESFTPPIGLDFIDHIVGNVPEHDMEPTVQWYEKMLSWHRFWSVDDKQMHTEYSALRSIVIADHDERVKMPINEPAPGKRKSQIQVCVCVPPRGWCPFFPPTFSYPPSSPLHPPTHHP